MTASERTHVDAAAFRSALRHLAGGVSVVTAAGPHGPVGLTVTSLTAASLDPPLLSFYVDRESRSLPGLRAADHFAVHLLTADQHELAALFARRGADRFAAPTRWQRGPAGVPLLVDAPVHLVCAREQVVSVGDHFLVVGSVLGTSVADRGEPLLYAHGEFGRLIPIPDTAGELGGEDVGFGS
jgi:flavin reductase (DIM6/NTAB) family NADH-FMN oxidoreductase RutF